MELISQFNSAKLNGRTVEAAVFSLNSKTLPVFFFPLSSPSAPPQSVLDRGSRPGCGQVLRNARGRGERQLPDEQRPDAGRRRAGDRHPEEVRRAAGERASFVVLSCESFAGCLSPPSAAWSRLGTMWEHESLHSHKSPRSARVA